MRSRRMRKFLEQTLAAPWCRAVISASEAARSVIIRNPNCSEFDDKLEVVPFAIPMKPFQKRFIDERRVRLPFVGTINLPDRFYDRRGIEVLECFRVLRGRYGDLELDVRSDTPPAVKRGYAELPGLRIPDQHLPAAQLNYLYGNADIFIVPGDHTPYSSLLDAMGHELPIIATNVVANPEVVKDGVIGLLARAITAPKNRRDLRLIESPVRQTSRLIDDPALRRRMGQEARREVAEGDHSFKRHH